MGVTCQAISARMLEKKKECVMSAKNKIRLRGAARQILFFVGITCNDELSTIRPVKMLVSQSELRCWYEVDKTK